MQSRGFFTLSGLLALALAGNVRAAEYCVSADADDVLRTHASVAEALDTAAMTAGADVIRIVIGAADAGQALVIAGHSVTLSGGYVDCADAESGDSHTLVSGAGTATGTSVLTIFGPAEVRLEHLDITGGTGLDGGGVNFVGAREVRAAGRLELADTRVFGNVAGRDGGGIRVAAQGDTINHRVDVVLDAGTRIDGNRAAENGGGLHLAGRVELLAAAAHLSFHDNEAVQGAGGAIYLRQPVLADIGSAPWNGEATFLRNRAGGTGGAIHFEAPGDADLGRLRLYSVVAGQPVVFEKNQSGKDGGALRVHGIVGPRRQPKPASVCAYNVNFIDNQAGDGAAMSLSNSLYYRCATGLPRQAPGDCEPRQACNRVEGNRNVFDTARAIVLQDSAQVTLGRATIVGNQSVGALFHLDGQDEVIYSSDLVLETALVADNQLSGESASLIRSHTGFNAVYVSDSTVAGNVFDPASQQASSIDLGAGIDELILVNDIIHQPGTVAVRAGNTQTLTTHHLLLHEVPEDLPPDPSIIAGDPLFVGSGDYRLQDTSPAIDFAPKPTRPASDLAGNPRGIDLLERPDVSGPTDLGAFETQPPPPPIAVFADGFEEP